MGNRWYGLSSFIFATIAMAFDDGAFEVDGQVVEGDAIVGLVA